MATITFPSQTQHSNNFLDGLIRTAGTFLEGVNDGLDMAHTYKRLSHMSEESLRKRGLTRAEIGRAVVLGRVQL